MGIETKFYLRVKIAPGCEEVYKEIIAFKYFEGEPSEFEWKHFQPATLPHFKDDERLRYMLGHEHACIKDGWFSFISGDFKNYDSIMEQLMCGLVHYATEGNCLSHDDVCDNGTHHILRSGIWQCEDIPDFIDFRHDYLERLSGKWFRNNSLFRDVELPHQLRDMLYETASSHNPLS